MDQLFLFSVSLDTFIQSIAKQGGMSFSNGYDVEFNLPNTDKKKGSGLGLTDYLKEKCGIIGIGGSTNATNMGGLVQMLCDEAQLPNVQAAVGQLSGRVMGESQISYPYARFYSDLSLTWMCDANMIPLKFLTGWHNYIFDGNENDAPINKEKSNLQAVKNTQPNPITRAIRLKYPEQYMCQKVKITKTEKGRSAPNSRVPISYILENVYPYSIDSVPLSYGTSQITKVTANFYYQKHTVVLNDGTDQH